MATEHYIDVIVLGLAALLVVALGAVVLVHSVHSKLHRLFFAMTLAMMTWIATNLVYILSNGDLQFWSALVSYSAAAGLSIAFIYFCNEISRYKLPSHVINGLAISIGLVGLLSAVPGLVATGIVDNKIVTQVVPLLFYAAAILSGLGAGVWLLVHTARRVSGQERNKYKFMIYGLIVGAVIGVVFNLFLPLMGIYQYVQFGPLGLVAFVAMSAYAIAKHGLFNIRFAVVRSVAYIMTLLTLSFVYYGLAIAISRVIFVASDGQEASLINPLSIVLALVLAYAFQPIKGFFDHVTNQIFFRASYEPEKFTNRLGKIFTSTVNLDELLELTATEIAKTLKASHVTFVVYDDQRNSTIKSHGVFRALAGDSYEQISRHLQKANEAIVLVDEMVGETYEHTEIGKLYRYLRRRNVELILPLHGEFGFLLLGEQKARGYSGRDYRVLNSLISELSIAIQNALSIQELRELNKTLQQRIDGATSELRHTNQKLRQIDATKDEFISMASHQLRTPLTSIKGYLSMVLEGDVGDISEQQRTMLSEAFTSSERMVHLIGDFLNVSRLQTGKFMIDAKASDLSQVIQDEVDSMRRLATSHGIDLEYKKSRVTPVLYIDEDKLRQVIMNFIDNAIFYSPENSTVKISLSKADGELRLEVSDEGMGVPEDVQNRLFTKFFRADNARKQRPDGTGIGLYLAKKVVTAHGGDIIFRTKKGKGSVFGFRLPIAKLSDKDKLVG